MFCPHCGKEISENDRFCVFCGKATAEPAPAKPKRKILPAILIGVGAFLVSALIIAPIVANSFKNGSDTTNTPQSQYTFPTVVGAENYDDSTVTTKIFGAESTGVASSSITFISQSGYAKSVIGFINIYDSSVEGFEDIKASAAQLEELIKTNGVSNAELKVEETDYCYTITFSFTNLDREGSETAAKTAAEFLGIPHTGGKIPMSDAQSTLLANGYTLNEEY